MNIPYVIRVCRKMDNEPIIEDVFTSHNTEGAWSKFEHKYNSDISEMKKLKPREHRIIVRPFLYTDTSVLYAATAIVFHALKIRYPKYRTKCMTSLMDNLIELSRILEAVREAIWRNRNIALSELAISDRFDVLYDILGTVEVAIKNAMSNNRESTIELSIRAFDFGQEVAEEMAEQYVLSLE